MKLKFNKINEDIEDEVTIVDDEVIEDASVQSGTHFIEDGLEYEWVEALSSRIDLAFDCWQVWSAKQFLTQEIKYFVVDPDLSFIDWGPCDTEDEAQEFLQGKIDDYEESEEDYADIVDMDLEDQFKHLMSVDTDEEDIEEESVLTEGTAKTFAFNYTVNGTAYSTTVQAPTMAEAEKQLKSRFGDNTCYITSKKEVITSQENKKEEESLKEEVFVVDDNFSDIPDVTVELEVPKEEETPAPPTVGENIGIANMLNDMIVDEWNTITSYNSVIATLAAAQSQEADDIINVIKDIVNEENIHVGQLQKALQQISPNVTSISRGEKEAAEQLT